MTYTHKWACSQCGTEFNNSRCPACGSNDFYPNKEYVADILAQAEKSVAKQESIKQAAEEYADIPHYTNCGSYRYSAFIAGANWQRENGWISVKTKEPELDQIVDTWNGLSNRRAYFTGKRFYRHVDQADGDRIISCSFPDITHWRELPQNPK